MAAASVGLFAVAALGAPMAQADPVNKRVMCHVTDSATNPYLLIEIPWKAGPILEHEAHGDVLAHLTHGVYRCDFNDN